MIKKIAIFLISSAACTSPAIAQEVYKQVDENGVPSFSDTKSKNAEKIIVDPINFQKIPEVLDIPPPVRSNEQEANNEAYSTLEIINPENGSTLHNEHKILLEAVVAPGLKTGHRLEFINNGLPIQAASKKTSITLTNFDRGTHTLSVRIIDKKGKVLQSGNSITVHVFRTKVQSAT